MKQAQSSQRKLQEITPYDRTEVMMSGPSFQVHPDVQDQINQGITQGFSQFFFNALDPNIAKTNVPEKQDSQMHISILIATIVMTVGIVVGAIIVRQPYTTNVGIALLVVPYLIYLVTSIAFSEIRAYITNLKKFNDYKQTYDKMVSGRGYFQFWIQCYHYQTVRTRHGTRRQKVVTHTATQDFFPAQSVDQSGDVSGIKDITKYVFIKYLKRFYFSDKPSEDRLTAAFNSFINRNKRDQQQNHTQTFDIEGFEEEVGFCMMGESLHNSLIFYILAFLGLALPYSCILERSVSRYSINILKRLTC